jgi:hypothetical protein
VTGLAAYRAWDQAQNKIRPVHRDRLAVVYVRQSSRQQVLEHTESTRLQYALLERAVGLGWARSRVMVIDDDRGLVLAGQIGEGGIADERRRSVQRRSTVDDLVLGDAGQGAAEHVAGVSPHPSVVDRPTASRCCQMAGTSWIRTQCSWTFCRLVMSATSRP